MEATERWKSGGFPFYVDPETKQVYVMLFRSNNSIFGGSRPQMSKGTPDGSETPLLTGIREVYEETGVPKNELRRGAKLVISKKFKGEVSTYIQHVYSFKLRKRFNPVPNKEGTGEWYPLDKAIEEIRSDQRPFILEFKKGL